MDRLRLVVALASLCCLILCVSVVDVTHAELTTEAQRAPRLHRESSVSRLTGQNPDLDYSKFIHNSQRHASQACTACHQRTDNSATPRFPGHKACTSCHLAQFVTPNVPMCVICHSDVNSSNPPLKSFPARFNESFNVKFDHAQHMSGRARPPSGCAACHSRVRSRPAALSIPTSLSAHNQCYSCHTPGSKTNSGQRNGVVWSLPRSKSLLANHDQCAGISLRIQSCKACWPSASGMCGLSFRNCRGTAFSPGEFTSHSGTLPHLARQKLCDLSQRRTVLRWRPCV